MKTSREVELENRILQLERELAERKAVMDAATRFVVPGEVDSSDAYLCILAELKRDLRESRAQAGRLTVTLDGFLKEDGSGLVQRLQARVERLASALVEAVKLLESGDNRFQAEAERLKKLERP